MRIVIATDKFKGSLTAPEVSEALRAGLLAVDATLEVDLVPVADGGEGTLDAAVGAGFTLQAARVSGPNGSPVEATFAVRGSQAVIEMASASGLDLVAPGEMDAVRASSRGTGELIRHALDLGCHDIVLGVGGSANTDGGAGMLAALGARFVDADGHALADGGGALLDLASVNIRDLDARLRLTTITLASDVDNPLLGARGAARVFGPQKGATPADVELLDRALTRLAEALGDSLGDSALQQASAPGAGAAGGVGYAALAVLGATRRPGIDVVLEFTRLAERVDGAALVITGEGSLDEQSLGGKTPVGVAQLAARAGVPVIAVCGRTTLSVAELRGAGIDRAYSLAELEPDLTTSMREAASLLQRIGTTIAESEHVHE
ncbi:MAG: glycerate kinase [Cryobacterium sp.]